MATSIVLHCRANGRLGISEQKEALLKFSNAYLREIRSYEADDIHKEVLINRHTATGLLHEFIDKVERKKSRKKMLKKCTCQSGDERVFDFKHKKLTKISREEYQGLSQALGAYQNTLTSDFTEKDARHFKVKDIARRMWSGTGSLGLDRFFVLLEGDAETDDDDIILDVKALDKPPLYEHMSPKEQKGYDQVFTHEGERHAEAYKALAGHPDKYLDWLEYRGQVFSVRERSPFKADFPTDKLKESHELYFMSNVWGKLLATRHERASHRLNDNPYAPPKALGKLTARREEQFENLVIEIALNYADRVEQDWECFLRLVE